jgi:ankyrin repeat protein
MEKEILLKRFRTAIANLDEQEIIACIERGVGLNHVDEYGYTAFTDLAFESKLEFSYTNLDIKERADLMMAEDLKKIELMKFLIRHGADINVFGEGGYTALDSAAGQAKVEVVEFLLENGANPNFNFFSATEPGCENVKSSILHTALSDVAAHFHEDVAEKFEKIVALLEKHGAILYR